MPLIFPSNPTLNQTYQSGSSSTYKWNGTFWSISAPAQTGLTVYTASYAERVVGMQSTPPATGTGSLWYDNDNGNMYVKYDAAWVPAQSTIGNAVTASFAATTTTASFAQSASLATRARHTSPSGWQLYSVDTNMHTIGSQNLVLQSPNFTFLSGSNVTFTVPTGFSATKVVFNHWNWGDAGSNAPAIGSIRYGISGSIVGGLTTGLGMVSWSQPFNGTLTTRWNAMSVHEVFNATPGTYTTRFAAARESEAGGVTGLVSWNVSARVEVYVQQ